MVLSRRDNRRLGPHNAGLVLAGVLGGSDGRNCGEATYERVAQCHGGGTKRVGGVGVAGVGGGRAGVKVNWKSGPGVYPTGGMLLRRHTLPVRLSQRSGAGSGGRSTADGV